MSSDGEEPLQRRKALQAQELQRRSVLRLIQVRSFSQPAHATSCKALHRGRHTFRSITRGCMEPGQARIQGTALINLLGGPSCLLPHMVQPLQGRTAQLGRSKNCHSTQPHPQQTRLPGTRSAINACNSKELQRKHKARGTRACHGHANHATQACLCSEAGPQPNRAKLRRRHPAV